jgi:hypothetical protein
MTSHVSHYRRKRIPRETAIVLQTMDRPSCYSRHQYSGLNLCPVQAVIKVISDVGCEEVNVKITL